MIRHDRVRSSSAFKLAEPQSPWILHRCVQRLHDGGSARAVGSLFLRMGLSLMCRGAATSSAHKIHTLCKRWRAGAVVCE